MTAAFRDPVSGGCLALDTAWSFQPGRLAENQYYLIWNRGSASVRIHVDGTPVPVPPDGILCLTPGQTVTRVDVSEQTVAIWFDALFYCLGLHDREVSCNGLLFNSASGPPVLKLDPPATSSFSRLLDVLVEEFQVEDRARPEMLRLLLKRFIIKCTRIARHQLVAAGALTSGVELVRQFSELVEQHFRSHRRVRDYARMMHKSPKTLANAFRSARSRSPREIILERVVLEAKRLLHYTDRSVTRIGRDLGFDDPAHFSRLIKQRTGRAPMDLRRVALDRTGAQHIGS